MNNVLKEITIGGLSYCVYCNQKKPSSEFSLEHIFPQSLGGHLLDDTFKTRAVCRHCNSIMGLFVDGAFLKSYFGKNNYASDALRYLDFDKGTPLPLIYFGQLQGLVLPENYLCEFWLSPCTGRILHIHSNYDERYYSYAGGNPITAKDNPGKAIFINAAAKDKWVTIGLRSFIKHFNKADRVVAFIEFSDEESYKHAGRRPNPEDKDIIDQFIAKYENPKRSLECKHSIQIDYYERFMAKLALGIGYSLLGSDFIETEYSNELRNFLRSPEPDARKRANIFFNNIWEEKETHQSKFLRWEGGITISITALGKYLILHANIFGKHYLVLVSPDRNMWEKKISFIEDGLIYILIPQREICVGPIPLTEFIAHKTASKKIQKLVELESMRIAPGNLPDR